MRVPMVTAGALPREESRSPEKGRSNRWLRHPALVLSFSSMKSFLRSVVLEVLTVYGTQMTTQPSASVVCDGEESGGRRTSE